MRRSMRRECRSRWIAVMGGIVALFLAGPVIATAGGTDPGAAGTRTSERAALEDRIRELEAALTAVKAELSRMKGGAPAGEAARIAELEKRIEALSREIERLSLGEAAAPAAGASVHGFGPAASKVYKVRQGVSVGGYGEMLYQNFAGDKDDDTPSNAVSEADFLRAVLYFGYKFNDRILFNSEIEFEHAIAGEAKTGEVALEFAYLDFKLAKGLGARGGLLLLPMGFLNELHEPPIFLSAKRPEVERVIIPTTWRENGVGLYGDAGPIAWRAYAVTSPRASGFSESQGIRGGRQGGAKARAADIGVAARVDWSPAPGFLLGASGFTGKTGQRVTGFPEGRLSLWDAHVEWKWRGFQVRGLYARGILGDAAAISALLSSDIAERLTGWYAEAGYNVLAALKRTEQELNLFCRYEELDTQDRLPAGSTADPANDMTVRTCGVQYRPIPHIAVKVDATNFSNGAGTAIDQVNFALGYLF
ncbi:MAG: hypothetical protein ACRD5D_06195 [Candidatus Polarisedimenticolia bacterium]